MRTSTAPGSHRGLPGPVAGSSRAERGVGSVEMLLVMGAAIAVFLLMLQIAVKIYADRVAQAAAEEGAGVARRYDGTAAGGTARAEQYLTRLSASQLRGTRATARRGAVSASVTVTGRTVSIVPGLSLRVRQTSTGPVERFVPEDVGP